MESPLEQLLMQAYKTEMLDYMEAHPEALEELIHLSLSDRQPYGWRAAWLLASVMEENDARVQTYIPSMIEVIKVAPDGQKRDLMRVLLRMELLEEIDGPLLDTCVEIWCQIDKIPSVRWNALRLALKIAEKYPELFEEMRLLTQDDYLASISPGIRRFIEKMMKSLFQKNIQ